MVTDSVICVACLTSNIKMYTVKNTPLYNYFEYLMNFKLSKLDGINQTMCYICYSQLQKCCRFIKMSQRAGKILKQLHSDNIQITSDAVSVRNERYSFVTVVKQLSIPSEINVTECASEESNYTTYSIVSDERFPGTVKEEPKDFEDQLTIEDHFFAVKHEPVEVTENYTENNAHVKCEYDEENEMISGLNTQIKTEIENINDHTLPEKKLTEKRIRDKPKKVHECTICYRKFGCPAYLLRHIRSHTGEKPFCCDSCGKSFTQRGHLIQHIRLHTGEKPFKCHLCKNKEFNHNYNYKTHMKKHFRKPTHTCNLCKSAFHQKGDLKRHMMSHTGEKPYACNICNVKFAQNCHLTKHMRTHTKEPYSCPHCMKIYSHKLDLKNHLKTHKERSTFKCPQKGCTRSFNKQDTLSNHIKSHDEEILYDCVKCDRTFKQKGHLTKHIITVHDKEKCDLKEKVNNHKVTLQDLKQEKNHGEEHLEEFIIP